jgi:hypothetical protein
LQYGTGVRRIPNAIPVSVARSRVVARLREFFRDLVD